jgi:internalin A
MLPPSASGRGQVQFDRLPTDADLRTLAEWMRPYPEMSLRVYGGYDGSIRDLEFLRHFPFLRRFRADALYDHLSSLDGLRHLPDDAVELGIGATKARLDLVVLGRFGALESLFLEGQTRHLEVLSSLTTLDDLTLRSITMPDLSLLLPLRRLRSLDLKLGGTRDLRLAPRVGELRYLELWLIKGLDDVSVVGEIPTLRSLFLQALRNVVRLPDLRGATHLQRVHLETMRGLRDLAPLATAPGLEQLVLIDMPQLTVDDLRPLLGAPSLREATLGLGSIRRNAEAAAMLGLPGVESPFDWRA